MRDDYRRARDIRVTDYQFLLNPNRLVFIIFNER